MLSESTEWKIKRSLFLQFLILPKIRVVVISACVIPSTTFLLIRESVLNDQRPGRVFGDNYLTVGVIIGDYQGVVFSRDGVLTYIS